MAPVHCGLCYAIDSGNYEGAPRRHDPECPNGPQSRMLIGPERSDDFKPRPELHPHATLATGRPPNRSAGADQLTPALLDRPGAPSAFLLPEPLRVDRWTVSIKHVTPTQVDAEVLVWARVPTDRVYPEDLDMLHRNQSATARRLGVVPKRKVITGATRLEVMDAVFAFLAGEV